MIAVRRTLSVAAGVLILIALIMTAGLYQLSEWVLHPPEYRPAMPGHSLPEIEKHSPVWDHYQGLASDPRADLGLDYEDVEFSTVEGGVLRGWFVPVDGESKKAIVAAHGAYFDRRDFLRRLPMLHEAGYPVLMFDCREHGMSSGSGRGPGLAQREHFDVASAVEYLRSKRGFESIAVFGQSQGATSSLIAASRDPMIVAVIAENAFAKLPSREFPPPGMEDVPWSIAAPVSLFVQWRAGALDAIEAVDVVAGIAPTPILFMHGDGDQIVPVSHARLLYERAGEPKQLWIGADAGHDALINIHPAEYESRVVEFLRVAFEQVGS